HSQSRPARRKRHRPDPLRPGAGRKAAGAAQGDHSTPQPGGDAVESGPSGCPTHGGPSEWRGEETGAATSGTGGATAGGRRERLHGDETGASGGTPPTLGRHVHSP